jgi:hypothetical protein
VELGVDLVDSDFLDPDFLDPEFFDSEFFESDVELVVDPDPDSDVDPDDSDFEVSDELLASPDAGDEADFLPRLSVLKKPEPLNVTPTGVKTFLTGISSPESGWATSVRFSSWNPCWTSIVSPVSTNLYTYVGIGVVKISSERCRYAAQ